MIKPRISAKREKESNLTPVAFDFHPQTQVVFGAGAISRLGELARELGASRVLLVTDPGLETAGHPQRATASLREAGLEVGLFDEVEENPTTRHVRNGVEAARKKNINFLVAVGGGSAMDCAKGINFLLTNGGQMADYKGFGKASRPMLPSITVPTTAGTGSEAQSYALISDERTNLKMACGDRKAAFRAAILDPEVTLSQPPRVTALTGIDALAHAVESFPCTRRNLVSQMFAREAFRLLEPHLLTVFRDPYHLGARGSMQLGAFFAGTAIENSMLGAAHACANPLTAHYGLTHGLAVGLLLPHVIRFNEPVAGPLYADLLGGRGLADGAAAGAAEFLAKRVTEFLRNMELPTRLSACGVSSSILPLLAEEANQQWTARFNPRPVTEDDLLQILLAAM